jgi:hypothetical protein
LPETIGESEIEPSGVPLPPIEEHERVVSESRGRLGATGMVRNPTDRQIELVQDRRRALITGAVAG